jgi:hypothetical protein
MWIVGYPPKVPLFHSDAMIQPAEICPKEHYRRMATPAEEGSMRVLP